MYRIEDQKMIEVQIKVPMKSYLTWSVTKCNEVKWKKQSEVEWGEGKCSIGKEGRGGGTSLYGKGF